MTYNKWRAWQLAIVLMTALLAALLMNPPRLKANVPCTLPVTLTNGTLADATQVMANFNALVTCLGQAAAAGNNTDITQLLGLTTALAPNSGGSATYTGGVSTGSANAQIVATTVPNSFTLTAGFRVTFSAGFTNTGPMTLTVNGLTTKNVFRKTQLGPSTTQGGEVIVGSPYAVVYDGTEFVLVDELFFVGEQKDWISLTPPPGWLAADGSCQPQATYPTLSSVLGTTFGTCGGANFALPDLRGRVSAGLDNMGTAAGAASRLTTGTGTCGTAMTAVGAVCANGAQGHTQTVAELAPHAHSITDPGHAHNGTFTMNGSNLTEQTNLAATGATAVPSLSGSAVNFSTNSTTTGITVNSNGGGNPFPIVNPNIGMLKIIRY